MLRSIFKRLPLVSAAALALGVATTGVALTQHALASTAVTRTSCNNGSTCLKWSNKGAGTAFSGTAISNYAFVGSSKSATGAYFSTGDSTYGYDGVLGTANGGAAGVGGLGYHGSAGVDGISDSGNGVYAASTSGFGAYIVSSSHAGALIGTFGTTNYALQADSATSGGYPFAAVNEADGGQFAVDNLGNGFFSGLVYTSGSCNKGCDKRTGSGNTRCAPVSRRSKMRVK